MRTHDGSAGDRTESGIGDLYLRVRLHPHPRYRVAGDHLETDLSLWPWQAVLGGEVRVDTLDGAVTLTVPPVVAPAEKTPTLLEPGAVVPTHN